MAMKKKSYSVSQFKAESLGIFEKIAKTGQSVVVTKRGKPIAQVIPYRENASQLQPGRLAHTLVEDRDVLTPFGGRLWKAAESDS